MSSLKKNLIKFGILLSFCMFFIFINPVKVYAWEAHLNENGDIEIYSVDKQKTSQIWYETQGVTITRCSYDPTLKEIHSSQEFFARDFFDMPVSELIGGVYYTTHTIPISEVIAEAGGEWAEEIQNALDGTGPACYIKIDCIMYTNNAITGNMLEGPYVNAPGVYGGDGYNETGISSSGVQIRNAYGWANPNGLKTHFNHYLLLGKEPDTPIIVNPDDEFVTYDYTMDHYAGIDANQPAFATSNYSSQFDLSQGIPSSEYIDNNFLADSWYGNTNVYARLVGKKYTWSITYWWIVPDGFIDPNAGTWVDTSYVDSTTVNIPLGILYVSFQYLTDTHLYDFTNADIANGAYDGDHVYYDDTYEVPMTCIATDEYTDVGTSVGSLITEEPNWIADTDAHVILPSGINYSVFRQVSDASAVTAAVLADRDAIRAQLSNRTQTRNDKLVVDGHEFMNNDWITGANFFDSEPSTYKLCTKSSAWQKDYCLKAGIRPLHEYDPADVTGNVSVQIPATVDNGYYYTTMNVYYQRLVRYSKTLSEFFAGE